MTERKPSGVDSGSWADQQISAAMARGDFDNIPGQGKPIQDLDKPYDEVWFARKLRAEGFDTEAMLPASLRLRRRLEQLPDQVTELRTESEVRQVVTELNEQIEAYLRMPSGPPAALGLVDPEQIVAEWRESALGRAADSPDGRRAPAASGSPKDRATEHAAGPRRSWWRRLVRSKT